MDKRSGLFHQYIERVHGTPPPRPPSASGERDAFEAFEKTRPSFGHDTLTPYGYDASEYALPLVQARWQGWQDRAALTPSPGIDAAEPVPVAYLDLGAGGYIDLGSDLSDDQLATLPKGRHMLRIIGTYGVDGYSAAPPAAQPSAEQPPVAWLQQNMNRPTWFEIAGANDKAVTKDWTDAFPVFRQPVAASPEPHPPSRACMCDECKPSFDNGADDPALQYDIVRRAPGPSAEWLAEATKMVFRLMQSANVEGAGHTPHVSVDDAKAALLAHLRTKP